MSMKSSIIFKTSLILGITISALLILLGLFFVSSEKGLINELREKSLELFIKELDDRKKDEIATMQDHMDFVSKAISDVSAEYIYNVDEDGLKMQLGNFFRVKEIRAIDVIDKSSGKTFVSAWKEGDVKYGNKLADSVVSKGYKKLENDTKYQNNVVGKVVVHYSDEEILQRIDKTKQTALSSYELLKEEMDAKVAASTLIQAVAIGAIVFVLVLIVVMLLKKMVKKPLEVLKQAMVDLVAKNDSTADYIDIFTNDEVGDVAKYFNRYITKIVYGSEVDGTLIGNAVEVVNKVKAGYLENRLNEDKQNQAMFQLQSVVNDMLTVLYQYTQQIIKTLNSYSSDDFTARTDKMGIEGDIGALIDGVNSLGMALSKMIAENLRNGLSLQDDSKTLEQTSANLSNAFGEQIELLRKTAVLLQNMTDELHTNSQKIDAMTTHAQDMKAIIGIIGDIADQTNLLALNAAIEAARAGEHGRGFAVVSDEVRKLAEKTQKSLSEINVSINGLIQSVEEVANTFKEQAKGIEDVHDTIGQVDEMTAKNLESTKNISSISKEVNGMADKLVRDSRSKKFLES